ncbi:universal stress protein [Nocardioides daphniae]|uniref:Universal stress protein n=1 Tax=Nocardioides daphniae TaxID=402297 RepID=A0A4P7UG94_9ACTN|nr:universal stress protein [Nocardioides daphniae]QCC78405.1 universal stress protein [Nocardioides daphniae]GGD12736.1 universal stress protein [Nocardioides daphniae]
MTTPTTTRTVAVAVDGSDANRAALDWAVMHAEAAGADLLVVTVAEPYEVIGPYVPEISPTEYLEPVVRAAVEKARETLPAERVKTSLTLGHPVPVLQELSASYDVLVLGKRGLGAFGRLVMGSTSIAVAGRSSAPVVVVPDGWEAQSRLDAPVVVGVDVDKDHTAGLRFAFELAKARNVDLKAVQVWEPHPALTADSQVYLTAFDDWVAASGAEFKTRLKEMATDFPDVVVEVVQVIGQPARHLLEEASQAQALVLGRDAKERLSGFSLGSVARGVLHHSDVPVAVIPA